MVLFQVVVTSFDALETGPGAGAVFIWAAHIQPVRHLMLFTLSVGGKPVKSSGATVSAADERRGTICPLKIRQDPRMDAWHGIGLKEFPSKPLVFAADTPKAFLITSCLMSATGLVSRKGLTWNLFSCSCARSRNEGSL